CVICAAGRAGWCRCAGCHAPSAIRSTTSSRAIATNGSAGVRPASCRRRRRATASSICEPASIAHQPADPRQADLDIEAEFAAVPGLECLDARPAPTRQRDTDASRTGHDEVDTPPLDRQIEIEGERAELLDDGAALPAHADVLARTHHAAADAARPD